METTALGDGKAETSWKASDWTNQRGRWILVRLSYFLEHLKGSMIDMRGALQDLLKSLGKEERPPQGAPTVRRVFFFFVSFFFFRRLLCSCRIILGSVGRTNSAAAQPSQTMRIRWLRWLRAMLGADDVVQVVHPFLHTLRRWTLPRGLRSPLSWASGERSELHAHRKDLGW